MVNAKTFTGRQNKAAVSDISLKKFKLWFYGKDITMEGTAGQ